MALARNIFFIKRIPGQSHGLNQYTQPVQSTLKMSLYIKSDMEYVPNKTFLLELLKRLLIPILILFSK